MLTLILVAPLAAASDVTLEPVNAQLLPVSGIPVDVDDWEGAGVRNTLVAPDGQWAWVTVDASLTWPEEVDTWEIADDAVWLSLGETRVDPVGGIEYGAFDAGRPGRRVRRPSSDDMDHWGWVFPIASVPSAATLHIEEHAIPLQVAPAADTPPSPADAVTVEVVAVEALDTLASFVRSGGTKLPSEVRPTSGQLVQVDVNLVATATNRDRGDGFHWRTDHVTLHWTGGQAAALGEWFGGRLATHVSHNPRLNEPPREPIRLFYIVPEGAVQDAHLRFAGGRVADVTVPGGR